MRKREKFHASLAADSSDERSVRALTYAKHLRQSTNEDGCLLGAGKVSGRQDKRSHASADKGLYLKFAPANVPVLCEYDPSAPADDWKPVGIRRSRGKFGAGKLDVNAVLSQARRKNVATQALVDEERRRRSMPRPRARSGSLR